MLVNLKGMPSWVTHNTSDPQWELGSLAIVHDRVLRYVKATAAVTAGEVVVVNAPSQVTNITGFSNVSDPGAGVYPYIEDSGESMTVNYYKGCYLYLSGNTGVGLLKRIRSNTATRIYYEALHPEMGETDLFSTTPDITTDYNIISPWHVKKCGASDVVQTVLGFAPLAFTAHYYGWIVCSGVGNPLMGGSGVIDTVVVPGDDTAGQGTISDTNHDLADATPFGIALYAGADDTRWPILFRGISL